jgi:microcystin-dependent protein
LNQPGQSDPAFTFRTYTEEKEHMPTKQSPEPAPASSARRGFLEKIGGLVAGSSLLAAAGSLFGVQRASAAVRIPETMAGTTTADPYAYIGEIRLFSGVYEPNSWRFCDGQLLTIVSNTALFAILGTTFGGNGSTNFRLPDLRGRVPLHVGGSNGSGLSTYNLGEMGGEESHPLSVNEIPAHGHSVQGSSAVGSSNVPTSNLPAANAEGIQAFGTSSPVTMNSSMIQSTGGSAGHENRQPYLGVNYIICVEGNFPSQWP